MTVQGPWAHGSPSTCIGIIEHFKISWIREQINRKTSVPKKLRQVFLNNDLYHPKSLNISFKDISYLSFLEINLNVSLFIDCLRDSFPLNALFLQLD